MKNKTKTELTIDEILKLKPSFKFGGMTMIDWFEVKFGDSFCCISSGLRHADGETKSPYHYDYCFGGKNSKSKSLKRFNKWWKEVNNKTPK